MNCDKILEDIEFKSIKENERIASIVIKEVLNKIEKNIVFLEDDSYLIQRLARLKRQYIYPSEYIEAFFNILEKYGYNPKREIIEAITKLSFLSDPKKNSELIHTLLHSPFIDDISFDGKGTFTITSPNFGEVKSTLASYRFRNNKSMKNYIQNNPLPGRCHNHTLFIRAVFPAYYAVTALCPAPFTGKYHHSFSYDYDSKCIIDLCSNSVMDSLAYEQLYEPEVVSMILNSRISEELKITKRKTKQPDERFALLKIALYKELLTIEARKENPDNPRILMLKK